MTDSDAVVEMRWWLLSADEARDVVLSVVIHGVLSQVKPSGRFCDDLKANSGAMAALKWCGRLAVPPLGAPLSVKEIDKKGLFHTVFFNASNERIFSLNIF